ncbi:MAG: hypothetical protein H0T42_33790 [Deltaproteobacteria bacterium]|nr:hypothetical protein [Deltaproteobacteria bacterium]
MIRIAALIVVCLVAACGAVEPRIRLNDEWPARVEKYDDVVDKWTRRGTLRGGYQEVLELAATLKSPEWRAAHASRDADNRGLQGEARTQLLAQAQAAAAGPYELQVMVTTWDRRENDLDRGAKSVWKIVLLDEQGMEVAPLEIVKDKRPAFVVRAEYPALGDFAQSYVARFPREAKILGPDVKRVRLRISSSRGGLELIWNDAP